ncbi:hypothetical protein AAA294_02190 [Fusobacterium varium]|uniref:hypothetical protein n=1 Tax=Fusobacterium varium TaxID=856 RepID=UPI0032C1ADC8
MKSEVYCSCGKFLYFIKNGWVTSSRGTKVTSNGETFKLRCSCGEITEFKIK